MRLRYVTLLACAATVSLHAANDAVMSLIEARCLSCHNDAQKLSGLSLASRASALAGGANGPAIHAADLTQSLIWKKVSAGQMPPGNPLPAEERASLLSWLESGAVWSRVLKSPPRARADRSWWSLRPLDVKEPPNPQGLPKEWANSAVDRFLFAAMQAKNLKPSPPADRRTLIRRVTFDLTGLPPTPAEIGEFEKDTRPNAYEAVVDRLLASPGYGERWGRHWLDVARFGESHGYEQNHLRSNAWQYRDYVIRSFNEDKPFDRMVLEQLAGDVVGKGDPDVEVATAFLVAGPHDTVGNQAEAARRQQRADDLDDMITATASGFLGLTVNCARCHDHKFDPIQQADYHRLQALLAGAHHGEREIATEAERRAWEAQVKPVEQALETARTRLKQMGEAAKSKADSIRQQVLSKYRPPVSPRLTEETFPAMRARFIKLAATSGAPGGLDELEIFASDGSNIALASAGAVVRTTSTRRPEANPEAYSERHLNDGRFDRRWFADGNNRVEITVALPSAAPITRVAWSSDRGGGFMGRTLRSTHTARLRAGNIPRQRDVDNRGPFRRQAASAQGGSGAPGADGCVVSSRSGTLRISGDRDRNCGEEA